MKRPQFKTEAEEAQWWFDNREELGREFVTAMDEDRLGEGSVARHTRKLREAVDAESQKTGALTQTK